MKRYLKYFLIAPPLLLCAAAVCLSHESGNAKQDIPAATSAQRTQWLAMQGISAQEIHAQQVTIPAEFTGSYAVYAALQDVQELPLAVHAGECATCITYRVTEREPLLYAELLIADGVLIGAQCYHPEEGITLTMQGAPFAPEKNGEC